MEDSQVKPLVKPSDLRIGNILDVLNESGVISQDTGYNWTVNLIGTTTVGLKKGDKMITVNYNELSPITLTEEWLKRCGYELKGTSMPKYQHQACVLFGIYKGVGFYMENVDYEIKFLHQLQNIFNSLKNKELTIKEVI